MRAEAAKVDRTEAKDGCGWYGDGVHGGWGQG
jgi:hypothetical protein